MDRRTVKIGWAAALVVGSVCLGTACGDDETSATGGSGGSGGEGATGGGGGAPSGSGGAGGEAPTLAMTWQVSGFDGQPIEGVEVCVDEAQPAHCATTDGTGEAVLMVPENTEIAVRAVKTGLVDSLLPIDTGTTDFTFDLVKSTDAQLAGVAQAFGVTLDPTKGTVVLLHAGGAPTGVAASIAPSSGDGPHYLSGTLMPDPQATELPQGGAALFFNVDPGTVTTSFAPALAGCMFSPLAWGTEAASTTTPVEAGVLSGPPNIVCQ